MQLTKSQFVLAARGVQLDNRVTSPCIFSNTLVATSYIDYVLPSQKAKVQQIL